MKLLYSIKFFSFFFSVFAYQISIGQNLIRNSSFENFNNIHNASWEGNFEAYTPSLVHIVNDWDQINSADHFDSAFTIGGYNVPYSRFGNSYAINGSAYIGVALFYTHPTIEVKEYIYQNLITPLKTDSTYCLSFYTTLADYSPLAVKNLGALFTINAPVANWYIAAAPQVQNNSGFITDTVNWVNISGCFTALGGENYITIGNFNSNANTDTAAANPVAPLTGTGSRIAYYYIDSVCLYQNNFPTAIKDLDKESDISIYPNPVTTSLNISYKRPLSKDASIEIINYLGQPVYLKPFSNQIDLSAFSSGIYFLTIQDGFFKRKIKIIKK